MGFSHKLKKTRLTEWKDYYINYDYLGTLFNDEKKFINEFNNEAAKVNSFFIAAEKTVLAAKDKVIKKKAGSECVEEAKFRMDYASDNFEELSSTSTDLGEPMTVDIENRSEIRNSFENEKETEVNKIQKKIEKTEHIENLEISEKGEEIKKSSTTKEGENLKTETIIEIDDVHQGDDVPSQEKKVKKSKVSSIFEKTKNILLNNLFAEKSKSIFKNNIFRAKHDSNLCERDYLDFIAAFKHIIAYRNINLLGFKNILIKYDKTRRRNLSLILMPQIERCHFNTSRRVDSLFSEVSRKYANVYYKNNPEMAKKILRGVNRPEKSDPFFVFLAGITVGAFIYLHHKFYPELIKDQETFYYAVGIILLGFVLFASSMIILKMVKINCNFIFGFVHGSQLENSVFLFSSSLFLVFHQIITYFCYDQLKLWIIAIHLSILFFPVNYFFRSSRIFLLKTLLTLLCPLPFFRIMFKDFIVADILLSYMGPIKKLIMLCKVENEYFLILLYFPYIRLSQCLRRLIDEKVLIHFLNTLKYGLSIAVEALVYLDEKEKSKNKMLDYVLKALRFFSSTYSFFWDLFFDWSIIRKEYTFPFVFYGLLVVYDFFIRFLWIFKALRPDFPEYVGFLMELFRRYLWLLVRIEQEHLNNCNKLEGVKFVDLKGQDLFYKKGYEPLDTECKTETEIDTVNEEEVTE